jgi:ketosteroid isomerase-like protein
VITGVQAIADRIEIEALRGEFSGAVMMRDYDRLASLFTEGAVVRIPTSAKRRQPERRSAPAADKATARSPLIHPGGRQRLATEEAG